MNLNYFNRKTTRSGIRDDKHPLIHISLKTGMISINQAAADLMVLNPGNLVMLANDQDNPKDWYIMKTEAISGFLLRTYPKSFKYCIQSRIIARKIAESLEIKEIKPITFQLATKPTITSDHQLFAILHKNHS